MPTYAYRCRHSGHEFVNDALQQHIETERRYAEAVLAATR